MINKIYIMVRESIENEFSLFSNLYKYKYLNIFNKRKINNVFITVNILLWIIY